MLQVEFRNTQPQPFHLTLTMQSWAMNMQGTGRAHHSATRLVDMPLSGALDLITLFSGPEDSLPFRNFILTELSWDGSSIAGTNSYTLEVEDIPGMVSEVSGNAEEGYRVLFSQAL